jgi:hypothetical protein
VVTPFCDRGGGGLTRIGWRWRRSSPRIGAATTYAGRKQGELASAAKRPKRRKNREMKEFASVTDAGKKTEAALGAPRGGG